MKIMNTVLSGSDFCICELLFLYIFGNAFICCFQEDVEKKEHAMTKWMNLLDTSDL